MLLIIFFVALAIVKTNSLQCVRGGFGSVNRKSGGIKEAKVTCQSQTKFCVKLESDTIVNREHVRGIARGCDQEMPGSSKHEFCKVEGCVSRQDTKGKTRVCCCTSDYCNDGTRTNFTFAVFLVTFSFLSFFPYR
ncbi:unnamed protein product [Litomosoides sigmodontis]|uniref:Activin types I and II receptor domain-containing protein n=1 Tax=Litomosoides sigmodontis TaxID=42156 RepID=A0A3P6SP30_LITSI|nr:unnamed protein product [Litomosoides sigmodontis]